MTTTYRIFFAGLMMALVIGCSSSREITTVGIETEAAPANPAPENIVTELSEEELLNRWMHLDGMGGKYIGVGTDKVYSMQLSGKQPQRKVIVAVIDSGIDVEHEDLEEVIWVNEDEEAENGIDDDGNGYIDDRYGWNFIGGSNGGHVNFDTFEVTREYARLRGDFENVDVNTLSEQEKGEYAYYQEILAAYEKEKTEMAELLATYDGAISVLDAATSIVTDVLGKSDFSIEEVEAIDSDREEVQQAQSILVYFDSIGLDRQDAIEERAKIEGYLRKGLDPEFDPRSIVGDDYQDPTERIYGNNDVEGPDAHHGTHVAGIIAAMRNNGLGMDGIANSVEIMPIRAVPNGDERDKDIANSIRYAVDNGADIINMSFGKQFSPFKSVVDEAILYAEKNDVLMVHAAGNDALDNDATTHFPMPEIGKGDTRVRSWIEVGASNWEGGASLAAPFSNYGKESVDLFAPGVEIYSTTPGNTYAREGGTSMAAPVVSGIAALIMAYYPEFSAAEVKDILIDSAVSFRDQLVLLPGSDDQQIAFGMLSRSGAVVNAYRAFQLAEERSTR